MTCIEVDCIEIKQEPTFRSEISQTTMFMAGDSGRCVFSIGVSKTFEFNTQLLRQTPLSLSFVCSLAKIFSCYDGGGWINSLPWINKGSWKNKND